MIYSFIKQVIAPAALLSATLSAAAYDFETDGIYYNILSEENCTAEVTRKDMNTASYTGDITIPRSCTHDGKEYNVVAIGSHAFYLCSGMTSITMPGSVTAIGDRAFVSCEKLTDITLPGSVTSIGEMAFNNCTGLTSFNIPGSVTAIAEAAFVGCDNLTDIIVDSDNPAYFSTDGILYDRARTSILCCPGGKTGVTSIPDFVTAIENQAFRGCLGLTSLTVPNSVTAIGDMAFLQCANLQSIKLPNSLTTIGSEAFFGCSSLPSIAIPASVTTIADHAFTGCSYLKSIEVDGDNPAFSSLDGILYNKPQTDIICCPVGKDGSVIIPGTVTAIGPRAFAECHELTSITMPNSITSIGAMAFARCSSLNSITIPGSVTSIGDDAFGSCIRLRFIYTEWATPIADCSGDAFDYDMMGTRLYVPRGCTEAYKAVEPWSRFTDIKEYNFVTGIDGTGCREQTVMRIFNLAGTEVADTPGNLPAGIYIVREGTTARKLLVR